jgi:hypothetical protein
MSANLFPLKDAGKLLKINTIWLVARATDPNPYEIEMSPPLPELPPGANIRSLVRSNTYGGLHFDVNEDVSGLGVQVDPTALPDVWHLRMRRPGGADLAVDLATGEIELSDLIMVLGYEWE